MCEHGLSSTFAAITRITLLFYKIKSKNTTYTKYYFKKLVGNLLFNNKSVGYKTINPTRANKQSQPT